jgi:hypothetical protein
VKNRKVVILQILERAENSSYDNGEVTRGANALRLKYQGRAITKGTEQYQQATYIVTADLVNDDREQFGRIVTISAPDTEQVRAFCAGCADVGLYIVAHGTRQHIGSINGGVSGTQLGKLVNSLALNVVYICVVACEAGKPGAAAGPSPVVQICDTFGEVASKPTIAGYGIPVFANAAGQKAVSVHGRTDPVRARLLRESGKPEGQRTKAQKIDDKNVRQAKANYKRVYVFQGGRWVETRAAQTEVQ